MMSIPCTKTGSAHHVYLLFLLVAASACKKKEDLTSERGAAPPPIASSKPGVCANGGGTPSDSLSASIFARTAGDYCVDPNGETRAYGDNAPANLDKVCTELFDGECEVYKGYGLKRVVTLRYVDGKGSPGAVNVNLSRFSSRDGAYAFFTRRVIADADPAETVPAKLEAGSSAAIGTGIAYVWRNDHVAELSYTNEVESPDQLKQSSLRVLPSIAKAIGDKMPGDQSMPPAVGLLPREGQIPMGTSYEARDVLGVSGAGAGAIGYYRDGKKRWRLLAIVRPDEDSAKDVMKTLKKLEGAHGVKNVSYEPLIFSLKSDESSPKIEWVVARKGSNVLGIGDEEHVLTGTQSAADAAAVRLSESEKLARLGALVGAGSEPAPEKK